MADIADLFDRIPLGWSTVRYQGRRYGVTKTAAAGGRSLAVLAQELGGVDVISANLYLTSGQPALRPCEMPAAKVIAFLSGCTPAAEGLLKPPAVDRAEGAASTKTGVGPDAGPGGDQNHEEPQP